MIFHFHDVQLFQCQNVSVLLNTEQHVVGINAVKRTLLGHLTDSPE
jgi:hypothetical protein